MPKSLNLFLSITLIFCAACGLGDDISDDTTSMDAGQVYGLDAGTDSETDASELGPDYNAICAECGRDVPCTTELLCPQVDPGCYDFICEGSRFGVCCFDEEGT